MACVIVKTAIDLEDSDLITLLRHQILLFLSSPAIDHSKPDFMDMSN